jgi:hypothetical protein
VCGSVLLGRADWLPGLRWASLAAGVIAALALIAPAIRLRRLVVVAVLVAMLSAGAGSTAYAAATASVVHTGSIPTSGPTNATNLRGTGGGVPDRMGRAGTLGGPPTGAAPGAPSTGSTPGTSSTSTAGTSSTGGSAAGFPGAAAAGPQGGGRAANTELAALLAAGTTKWSAAVNGATSAADLELATGTSVMALGGWNGSVLEAGSQEGQAGTRTLKISPSASRRPASGAGTGRDNR